MQDKFKRAKILSYKCNALKFCEHEFNSALLANFVSTNLKTSVATFNSLHASVHTFTILFVLHDDVIIFEKMAAEVHLLSSAFHQTRYLIGGRFVLNRW